MRYLSERTWCNPLHESFSGQLLIAGNGRNPCDAAHGLGVKMKPNWRWEPTALILTLFENALVGKEVSHVWQGYGSALFVEFGKLDPSQRVRRDGSLGNPVGEITLMIEWSWRIERPKSIMGGSWSSERKWPAMFEKLKGARVTRLKVFGSLPEIEVSLSNGLRVVSFMTAEGQPEWSIICRNELKRTLGVQHGKLHVEELAPNQAFKPTGHKKPWPAA